MKPSRKSLCVILTLALGAMALVWRSGERAMTDEQRIQLAPFLEAKSLVLLRISPRFELDGVEVLEETVLEDPVAVASVKRAIEDMAEASNRPGWGRMLTTFVPEYGIRVENAAGVHDMHIAPSWNAAVYLNDRSVGNINFSYPPSMERWLFGDDSPDLRLIDQLLRSEENP